MRVFSLAELSVNIKAVLENSFDSIKVKGEVIQPKRHTSGHLYFTIKQDNFILDCVAWRNAKLAFEPQDGSEVICQGTITAYSGRSKYQISITNVEHVGLGAVLAAIEDRKKRLTEEGIFEKKLQIPQFPKIIGIATSKTGSVLHDMLHRLRDRYPTMVALYPIPVQGSDVVKNALQALEYFQKIQVDIIILARGGGSFEDLLPFQDEILVRAIAGSTRPVVTAIGHETDTTLADLAAAMRAPTPTAAIELITPDKKALQQICHNLLKYIRSHVQDMLENRTTYINRAIKLDIQEFINFSFQKLDYIASSFHQSIIQYFKNCSYVQNVRIHKPNFDLHHKRAQLITSALKKNILFYINYYGQQLNKLDSNLHSLSYQNTLYRGFCIATQDSGIAIYSKKTAIEIGRFNVEFEDGMVKVVLEPTSSAE